MSLGEWGERYAAKALKKKGYRILSRNFRTSAGEIDLIASFRRELVFVEVKTRRSLEWGEPFEAVNLSKQKQILKISLQYIQLKKPNYTDIRFDIISIFSEPDKEPRINHIENAFDASCSAHFF
ncbi:YraN family protein [PVC group bacterium (ex Bugula neritina AB1)]|nr:YraN family protein [PVC group bacterium (ex Bugula neritina AB1)]